MPDNDKPSTPPPSKQDVMREIGQALADRRKARGLTVEKVSQILKIRLPYLKAMEQGDWGELPGEVYARGFVKRYAVYLGMDADKLLSRYLTDKTPDITVSGGDDGKATGSDASKGVLVAVGVAAVFLIILIKLARNEKGAPAHEKAETVATSTATAKTEPAAKPAAPAVATGETTAPADSHKLEVYSPYPLWVRVNTEDKNFEGFIPDNATWTWTAKGKFTVRLGHNRKVWMAFDGVQVPLTENQKKVELPE